MTVERDSTNARSVAKMPLGFLEGYLVVGRGAREIILLVARCMRTADRCNRSIQDSSLYTKKNQKGK